MFTAAFDASGHESDQLIMVVAGFVAPADAWIGFSKLWKDRLARDGLEYFRMEEFKYWRLDDEARRRALLSDLMTLIRAHASRKFGHVLVIKDLNQALSDELKRDWHINAYTLAGMYSVIDVDEWAKFTEKISTSPEYVFEEGDIGQAKLYQEMTNEGFIADFRPGKLNRKTPSGNLIQAFVPLQAADFIAGEYFMEEMRRLTEHSKRPNPRWAFGEFESFMGVIRHSTLEGLRGIQKMFEMCKSLDSRIISDDTQNEQKR